MPAPALARRRHRRVRPYLPPPPAEPTPPAPSTRDASPVPLEVLARVRDGLRHLAPTPPQRPRAEHARELAAQLRPLAWRARLARPEAWAPAEDNAPHPDVTTTAPLEVVPS